MHTVQSAPTSYSTSLEQLIAYLIVAWNTHGLDRASAFFADSYVGNDVAHVEPQRAGALFRSSPRCVFHAG